MTDDEKQSDVDVVDDVDDVVDAETADATDGTDDETADGTDDTDGTEADAAAVPEPPRRASRPGNGRRIVVLGVLPVVAVLLAAAAGFLKWHNEMTSRSEVARGEAVQVARDTVADILSYQPDTVDQQLGSARDLLTGDFLKSYTALTTEVVIPGAKQQQISATATTPQAAAISATPSHAVVLVAVNQVVSVGQNPPSRSASSVRVTLDKVGDRWLVSEFEPV